MNILMDYFTCHFRIKRQTKKAMNNHLTNSRHTDKCSYKRRIKNFIPYLSKAEENENSLHWLAIFFVWLLAISTLAVLVTIGPHKINLAQLLETTSIFLALAGTIWISAGVIYTKPNRLFTTLHELQNHITIALKSASNHALVGIGLITISALLSLLTKADFITNLR